MSQIENENSRSRSLIVNGEKLSSRADTVADLLEELGYGNKKVATALNGNFIATKSRAETRLLARDRIEIVAPRQGG
ncbi:MAG: sulfur carrier protein ThiS [Hyphomicrobiaceae bacterium]